MDLNELIALYRAFWTARAVDPSTVGSADEHFTDPRLDAAARLWLRAFVALWDATEDLNSVKGSHRYSDYTCDCGRCGAPVTLTPIANTQGDAWTIDGRGLVLRRFMNAWQLRGESVSSLYGGDLLSTHPTRRDALCVAKKTTKNQVIL